MHAMDSRKQFFISFTDLIYAALLGYGLQEFDKALTSRSITAAFVATAILYLIYDWYGEHSLEVNTTLGSLAIQFDFVALIIYFGLIYYSTRATEYFILLMAARAARGIAINIILLRSGNPAYGPRLKSYNVSSSLMAGLYILIFIIDVRLAHFTLVARFIISFGLWCLAYAAALTSEYIYSRKYREQDTSEIDRKGQL